MTAYVLHSRPYRETSLLIEAFTLEQGRITLVARGAKRGKTKASAILQPFYPLSLSWCGNGELVTLTQVEQHSPAHRLSPKRIICGLYLNELLVKLLHKWDPCENLFNAYQQALQNLEQDDISEQKSLRHFEKRLLQAIGYGLQLTREIKTGLLVDPHRHYCFDPSQGPTLASNDHFQAVSGAALLALEAEVYDKPELMADIKRLMRLVFAYHLGSRTLVTRKLL
jgi:DNA repair protein RecO (recombination protein O)